MTTILAPKIFAPMQQDAITPSPQLRQLDLHPIPIAKDGLVLILKDMNTLMWELDCALKDPTCVSSIIATPLLELPIH